MLIIRAAGKTGRGRAKRKVDRVAAKDNRVLNCRHIVRVVSAAACAKDFHDDNLRVGRNALHLDLVQCAGERAVRVRNIGVCRRNALNVRAVLTLRVMIVVDHGALINIVVAKWDFRAYIKVRCCRAGVVLDVQLIQRRRNLCLVKQIQALLIFRLRQILLFGVLFQRIFIARRRERLVVGVDAGVDHGNPAARAGVARRPNRAGADLCRRGRHVGIVYFTLIDNHGLIARLKRNALDARNLGDFVNLAIADIGRDQIRRQRQIPDNLGLLSCCGFNLLHHSVLLRLQLRPVCRDRGVRRNILRAVKLHCRCFLQYNGHTHQIIVRVCRLVCFLRCRRTLAIRIAFRIDVVCLFKRQLLHLRRCALVFLRRFSRRNRDKQSRKQRQCKKQTEQPARTSFSHIFLSFFSRFFIRNCLHF